MRNLKRLGSFLLEQATGAGMRRRAVLGWAGFATYQVMVFSILANAKFLVELAAICFATIFGARLLSAMTPLFGRREPFGFFAASWIAFGYVVLDATKDGVPLLERLYNSIHAISLSEIAVAMAILFVLGLVAISVVFISALAFKADWATHYLKSLALRAALAEKTQP